MGIEKIFNLFRKTTPVEAPQEKAPPSKTSHLSRAIPSKEAAPASQAIEKGRVKVKVQDDFKEIATFVQLLLSTSHSKDVAKKQADRLARGIDAIRQRMESLPEAADPRKAASEITIISKEFEKIGPKAIDNALKELTRLKTEYFKLRRHATTNREAMELIDLEIAGLNTSLMSSYKQLAEIRKLLTSPEARLDERVRESLLTAHAYLSNALNQTSRSPEASVEFPSVTSSRVTSAWLIMRDKYSRRKFKEALGAMATGITTAAKNAIMRNVFRDLKRERPSKTMDNAKAAMVNSLAALSLALAVPVFGKSLVAASRNVVRTRDTANQNDIILQKILEKGIRGVADRNELLVSRAVGGAISLPVVSDRHIADGVCAGFSLELCLRVLRHPHDDAKTEYLNQATGMAEGAPPEAHAHQAIYQAWAGGGFNFGLLDEMMAKQQAFALDPQKGVGIFKANYAHVKECFDAIVAGGFNRLGNDASPLAKAVNEALILVKKDLLQTRWSGCYIRDLPQFKAKVLEALKNHASPGELQQAENELEWLLGNLELKSAFAYVAKQLDTPFIPLNGVDLEKAREESSTEACLEAVSKPGVRASLQNMIDVELDYFKMHSVARARGASLVRMEDILGYSFGAESDSDMLDRMSALPDGSYILSIDLQVGGHALQFYKKGDVQYLFDPNFGVIDCSHGTHKEQITKLLRSLSFTYPEALHQGPNSKGGSHNISLLKVVPANEAAHPDLLAGVNARDFTIDAEGNVIEKARLAMDDLIPPEISFALRDRLLKHANFDERRVKIFVKELNSYALHGALGKSHAIVVGHERAEYTKEEQEKFVLEALGIERGSPLGQDLLAAMKLLEKPV